jgi:guanylate kinase
MNVKLLFIFFCFQTLLYSDTLVVLRGASSSGKTSICKAVRALNENWCVIEEDELYIEKQMEAVADRFPREFQAIAKAFAKENRFAALRRHEFCFIEAIDEATKQEAIEAIRKIEASVNTLDGISFRTCLQKGMVEDIHKALSKSKNVLFDDWLFSRKEIEEYFNGHHIVEILVYCPLLKAMHYLEKRNEEAVKTNNFHLRRFWTGFIVSFHKFYRLTTNYQKAIDTYKKSDVELFFQRMSREVVQSWEDNPASSSSWAEMNLANLYRLKEEFLPLEENLFLEPKEKYEMILNTGKLSPEESAHLIVNSYR